MQLGQILAFEKPPVVGIISDLQRVANANTAFNYDAGDYDAGEDQGKAACAGRVLG
jgi:hypothetical protein